MGLQAERRRRRFVELVEGEHVYDGTPHDVTDLHRFVLIERSRFDRDIYVTDWENPADAADYHDGQEEPENWIVEELVDLDTGRRHTPTITTSWSNA